MTEIIPRKIYFNKGYKLGLSVEIMKELGWEDQTQVVLEIKEKQLIVKKLVLAE